jgi:hypothetical protein
VSNVGGYSILGVSHENWELYLVVSYLQVHVSCGLAQHAQGQPVVDVS